MNLPRAMKQTPVPPPPRVARHLLELLPALAPEQARLSRLGHDARFEHWLRQALAMPSLAVSRRPRTVSGPSLVLECNHGRLHVAIDTDSSPALSMALAVSNPRIACGVAGALLQPVAEALAPLLPDLRVVAVHAAQPPRQAALTIVTPIELVALLHCDAGLHDHLAQSLPRAPVLPLPVFAGLGLRGRICVMRRRWTSAMLRSLRVGDVVLVGAARAAPAVGDGHWRASIRFGRGRVWRAAVHLHPLEQTVHIADSPQLGPEGPDDHEADAAVLDDLQLPVSFELDTARISLAELARMQPGYAIELEVPLMEAMVRLVCHGQTVGAGQLMAIGDQLGVRITRMGLRDDAAAQP